MEEKQQEIKGPDGIVWRPITIKEIYKEIAEREARRAARKANKK